jgi:hypothetical protein
MSIFLYTFLLLKSEECSSCISHVQLQQHPILLFVFSISGHTEKSHATSVSSVRNVSHRPTTFEPICCPIRVKNPLSASPADPSSLGSTGLRNTVKNTLMSAKFLLNYSSHFTNISCNLVLELCYCFFYHFSCFVFPYLCICI